MLRTSLRSVRVPGAGPVRTVGGRQWLASAPRSASLLGRRYYVEQPKTSAEVAQQATEAATPPPPAKPKSLFRRLRSLILTLTLLGALGFGSGVWYSRVNDNFHDFFTEYVPFGEQAVLYLEEMDFRKRFPQLRDRVMGGAKARDTGDNVRVPAQSGASWRVANHGDPAGRQSSAIEKVEATVKDAAKPVLDAIEPVKQKVEEKVTSKVTAKTVEPPKSQETPRSETTQKAGNPPKASVEAVAAVAAPTAAPAEKPEKKRKRRSKSSEQQGVDTFVPPEVDEPSRFPPLLPLDPIKVNGALEPVVQDLVHMLNDLIAVVNADNAHEKYNATLTKAKAEISKVGGKISALKQEADERAALQVRAVADQFKEVSTVWTDRVEQAMNAQEAHIRRDFEDAMQRAHDAYDERVRVMQEREQKLAEERLANALREQAIALSRSFTQDLKDRVEQERGGRLGQLGALSATVAELDKLTAGWTDVVDANLRTQQLHVALAAVQAALADDTRPRPFTRELVALKETAADDPVVAAAVASINPAAYQRGVASPAQLVDRFRRVAAEARRAALLPEGAGVASHASSRVLSRVLFRREGLADGTDVESVLTRAQTYLEEGDLDAAAREVNGLGGWAKTLSRDWLAEVRKVLEVQQALDVIATEARLQSLQVE